MPAQSINNFERLRRHQSSQRSTPRRFSGGFGATAATGGYPVQSPQQSIGDGSDFFNGDDPSSGYRRMPAAGGFGATAETGPYPVAAPGMGDGAGMVPSLNNMPPDVLGVPGAVGHQFGEQGTPGWVQRRAQLKTMQRQGRLAYKRALRSGMPPQLAAGMAMMAFGDGSGDMGAVQNLMLGGPEFAAGMAAIDDAGEARQFEAEQAGIAHGRAMEAQNAMFEHQRTSQESAQQAEEGLVSQQTGVARDIAESRDRLTERLANLQDSSDRYKTDTLAEIEKLKTLVQNQMSERASQTALGVEKVRGEATLGAVEASEKGKTTRAQMEQMGLDRRLGQTLASRMKELEITTDTQKEIAKSSNDVRVAVAEIARDGSLAEAKLDAQTREKLGQLSAATQKSINLLKIDSDERRAQMQQQTEMAGMQSRERIAGADAGVRGEASLRDFQSRMAQTNAEREASGLPPVPVEGMQAPTYPEVSGPLGQLDPMQRRAISTMDPENPQGIVTYLRGQGVPAQTIDAVLRQVTGNFSATAADPEGLGITDWITNFAPWHQRAAMALLSGRPVPGPIAGTWGGQLARAAIRRSMIPTALAPFLQ